MEGLLSANLASKASVFGSSGGSNIKSIQRGTATIPYATNQLSVTINAVDVSKSIALCTERQIFSDYSTYLKAGIYQFTTTSLGLKRYNGGTSQALEVDWQVIEFNNVKSKQSGSATPPTGSTQNVTINSVNMNKSILIVTSYVNNSASNGMEISSGILTSSTNIQLRGSGSGTPYVYWQVIEFN